ncbi:MAG: transglycosylase SLT domain-containing protein [Parvibaculaceae bacterium]
MLVLRSRSARSHVRLVGTACAAALVLATGAVVSSAWAAKDDSEPAADSSYASLPERTGQLKSGSASVKAVDAALAGKLAAARDLAQQSGDPLARKLVEWLYLKDGWRNAGYDRVMAFVRANPSWPLSETMGRQAETLLFLEKGSVGRTLAHFSGRAPLTPEGRIALARAELAQGNSDKARALIVDAWTNTGLSSTGFDVIVSEFRSFLSQRAIETRLWKQVQAQEVRAALKTAKLLSSGHMQAVEVAASLLRDEKGSTAKWRALPAEFRNSQALRYAAARNYRRGGYYDQAAEILLAAPSEHAKLYDPEAWWIERRLVVRGTLDDKGSWRTAYKLAAGHGYSAGEHFCEGEFLAGWIALRKLKDAKTALRHFSRIAEGAPNRTEASRGHYWTGRAYSALGDSGKASQAYKQAAATPTLYYGQLAREALGRGGDPIPISTAKATDSGRAAVSRDELMRAFKLLADAGAERELGIFLRALAARFNTPAEAAAVASIVSKEGGAFMAVRFAKAASGQGVDIDDWGYPARAIPDWKGIGKPIERSAVYGLIRQESEFNSKAVSHAGARGLMQLMPGTAKLVTRQYKLSYNERALTADPSYNVKLGAAHLADLVEAYDGSYILSFVAYNAGPRRAREWIAKYGDPRSPGVDPIDWVESVPFTETRKYIQKVLQNVQVYRARLDPQTSMPISLDLARGSVRRVSGEAAKSDDRSCATEALSLSALINAC